MRIFGYLREFELIIHNNYIDTTPTCNVPVAPRSHHTQHHYVHILYNIEQPTALFTSKYFK